MGQREVDTKRVFSFDEARALLPEVQYLTKEAAARIEALSGADDAPAGSDLRAKRDEIVESWAEALIRKGLEVKGVWLVDFDNGSGYYCWRHPEPQLQFYHSYEDGFSGRMRIQ